MTRRASLGRRIMVRSGVAGVMVVAFAGPAMASHWWANGWRDKHQAYPPKPNGIAAINATFGSACNADADDNSFGWYTADANTTYNVIYHRKLGPASGSTNLSNDIRGHIGDNHKDSYVKSGIWGYYCRYVSGTTKYSTHAWGIAVDQNARFEHYGHAHNHTIDGSVSSIWQSHVWTWGLSFNDAMHFQYADGY